jgi:transposase IS66 family protein
MIRCDLSGVPAAQAPRCELEPGVAGTWVNAVGEAVLPLINLMHEALLSESFVQMDETYLQVVRSEKAPASDHYMVVRAAGPPGRRIILFNYEPSRTLAAPVRRVRNEKYTYLRYPWEKLDNEQLFNRLVDPNQLKNIIHTAPSELVDQLRKRTDELIRQLQDA